MAVKFRKVRRKVRMGADAGKTKTYAVAKANGYCDLNKLCKLISARSAISSADCLLSGSQFADNEQGCVLPTGRTLCGG